MTYQWEPQWVDKLVEYAGVRLMVKRDKVTGLLKCPICGDDKPSYFFTPKDLILHIIMHAQRDWKSERVVVAVEVEEGEEQGEE